jgi:hypothetical protein
MNLENRHQVLDLDFLRCEFPVLETQESKEWSFLDNPGGCFPCAAGKKWGDPTGQV